MHRGVQRGAWRVCRGVHGGCAEGCMEGVQRGVWRGMWRGVQRGVRRGAWRWLLLATINKKWVIIGNLKFEAYFEILYLLYVVDSLRTLKVYHFLSMVTVMG